MTRVASLRLFAGAFALSCSMLLGGSCLNPRPEELPSADNGAPQQSGGPGTTGNDPGIGGDSLPPNFSDDGEAVGAPNAEQDPRTPGNMSGLPGASADAGAPGGEALPGADGGADGG